MKIKTKLQLFTYSVLLMSMFIIFFLFLTSKRVIRAIEQDNLAVTLVKELTELQVLTFNYILNNEEQIRTDWVKKYNGIEKYIENSRQVWFAEEAGVVKDLDENNKAIQYLFNEIVRVRSGIIKAPHSEELEKRLIGQILIRSQKMITSASELEHISMGSLSQFKKMEDRTVTGLLIFLIAGVILLGAVITKKIISSLAGLQKGAEALKTGDLKYRIENFSNDELGDFGRLFNQMTESLQESGELLHRNEERLRLALMAANQGLYDLNIQTGDAIVSPEYALMLGYDPTTFKETNQAWIDRLHPDDHDPIAAAYQAYINGEIPEYRVEFRQRTISGDWKWILSLGKVVERDTEGRALRMLGTHTDITERKKAETTLQKSEALYRDLIETSQDLIWQCDAEGRYTYLNPAWEDTFGYKVEEMLGKKFSDFQSPEYAERDISEFARLMQGNIVKGFETIHLGKEGREIHLVFNAKFMRDENGNIAGTQGTAYDITERKKAEEKLRESEERYHSLFESANDAIYLIDPHTQKIVDCNRKAAEMDGYDIEEFKKMSVVNLHPFEERSILPEKFKDVSSKGAISGISGLHHLRKDGRLVPIEVNASMIGIGKEILNLSIVRDITERKQAEEKIFRLNRLYSVLSKTNEAIVRIYEPEELYREICRIAVEEGLFRMVWLGIVDPETHFVKPVAHGGVEEGYLDNIRISVNPDIPEGRGPTGTAIREGRYFVCNDIKKDQRMLPWREEALKRGYRSSAAFPLKAGSHIIGTINLYKSEPYFFQEEEEEEVRLLSSFSDDLAFALESIEEEKRRKRAEEALRISEEKFAKAFQSSPDIIVLTSLVEGRIVEVNDRLQQATGYTRDEIIGKRTNELQFWANPADREQYTALLRRDGRVLDLEVGFRIKSGEIRDTLLSGEIVELQDGKYILGVIRDITERKQAEEKLRNSREQLRDLSTHLQSLREEERTKIAREIHDELGQALTGLKMDLSWVNRKIPQDQKVLIEKMDSMSKLIDTIIQTVRKISSELRPGILDDLGLIAAIEWQAGDFQYRTGITCEFASSLEEIELDKDRSTAVFRIVQETLTNVVRHANATQVNIKVDEEDANLLVRVEDNGRGIVEKEISSPKSLGLLGMRERAHIFGGEVEITGEHGKGTTVTVRIPLIKD